LIRNRSIKLVLRANHKIASPRILSMERVAEKNYDHTILLESKKDIDEELIRWLEEAYITSN
jgi:HEPN domain-containing protein